LNGRSIAAPRDTARLRRLGAARPARRPDRGEAWAIAEDRITTFPKARVDALTDGIFAFAMTLLILDVRLPLDVPLRDASELIARLRALWPEYLAYVISFFVLAGQWRNDVALRHSEDVSGDVLWWTILYLFFITSVPFSSSVVGLHGNLPPAVWLYAANLFVVGALSLRLRTSQVAPEHRLRARIGATHTLFFMATALLSALVSLVEPGYAMYAYLLNFAAGPLSDRLHRPRAS